MPNDKSNLNEKKSKKVYDLEDRTFKFGLNIVEFTKKLSQDIISRPIISQLIRSGTSIGANYCEADGANSKRDFINKIAIAKKETKETKYWLKMIAHSMNAHKDEAMILFREGEELNLIFASIIRNSQMK